MFSSFAQAVTISLDVLLSIVACAVFFQPKLRKRYSWLYWYLLVRAGAGVAIAFLLYGPLLASPMAYTKIYFVVSWFSYLVSNVLLFLGCLDAYRQAMVPLPGLARMGTPVFRWAAAASILVTATTLTSITFAPGMLMKIGVQLMRCLGTVEICLVALLLLMSKSIGLLPRSRPFGIALGLGILAAVNCGQSAIAAMMVTASPGVQLTLDLSTIFGLGLWIAYAAIPETASEPVTVALNSAVYKWDQIASALGHKNTQVAPQPAPSFFLVDVEKVVERAFVRTIKGKES